MKRIINDNQCHQRCKKFKHNIINQNSKTYRYYYADCYRIKYNPNFEKEIQNVINNSKSKIIIQKTKFGQIENNHNNKNIKLYYDGYEFISNGSNFICTKCKFGLQLCRQNNIELVFSNQSDHNCINFRDSSLLSKLFSEIIITEIEYNIKNDSYTSITNHYDNVYFKYLNKHKEMDLDIVLRKKLVVEKRLRKQREFQSVRESSVQSFIKKGIHKKILKSVFKSEETDILVIPNKDINNDSVFITSIFHLKMLGGGNGALGDGTFALNVSCLTKHEQIFKINVTYYSKTAANNHSKRNKNHFKRAAVYFCGIAILQKKDIPQYEWLFGVINNLFIQNGIKIKFTTYISDFEWAQRKAWKKIFPLILTQGETFHWNGCIWKAIQRFHLKCLYEVKKYSKDNQIKYDFRFRAIIEIIWTFPYIPKQRILIVWKNVVMLFLELSLVLNDIDISKGIIQLICYIQNQWMEIHVHGCRKSQWKFDDWIIYQCLITSNNATEALNRHHMSNIEKHPEIFKFFYWSFRELQKSKHNFIQDQQHPNSVSLQREKIIIKNERANKMAETILNTNDEKVIMDEVLKFSFVLTEYRGKINIYNRYKTTTYNIETNTNNSDINLDLKQFCNSKEIKIIGQYDGKSIEVEGQNCDKQLNVNYIYTMNIDKKLYTKLELGTTWVVTKSINKNWPKMRKNMIIKFKNGNNIIERKVFKITIIPGYNHNKNKNDKFALKFELTPILPKFDLS